MSEEEGLTLSDTPLTDEDLAHLGNLPKLEWLQLSGTLISDDGLLKLASLNSLSLLRIKRLTKSFLTDSRT